jgi:uncharacterized RDD family membrane protein YckC
MQSANIGTSPLVIGSAWARIGSYLIDMLIFMTSVIVVTLILSSTLAKSDSMTLGVILICLALVAWFLYFPLMESSQRHATLGKMALHLQVVDSDGRGINFGRALGRNLIKLLCIGVGLVKLISFCIMLSNDDRKTIHDYCASTRVVKT